VSDCDKVLLRLARAPFFSTDTLIYQMDKGTWKKNTTAARAGGEVTIQLLHLHESDQTAWAQNKAKLLYTPQPLLHSLLFTLDMRVLPFSQTDLEQLMMKRNEFSPSWLTLCGWEGLLSKLQGTKGLQERFTRCTTRLVPEPRQMCRAGAALRRRKAEQMRTNPPRKEGWQPSRAPRAPLLLQECKHSLLSYTKFIVSCHCRVLISHLLNIYELITENKFIILALSQVWKDSNIYAD